MVASKRMLCAPSPYCRNNSMNYNVRRVMTWFPSWLVAILILTLNVPGDCGSSRPTRVEPRLHCVGIEWQVRGRCMGSAAHSPLHAIAARALSAARAIEPRPTHFARVRALGVPRTHNAARALCVGPRTLRGSAHFAWARAFCVGSHTLQPARLAAHALISFSIQFSIHSICYPSKPRPILSKANTIF